MDITIRDPQPTTITKQAQTTATTRMTTQSTMVVASISQDTEAEYIQHIIRCQDLTDTKEAHLTVAQDITRSTNQLQVKSIMAQADQTITMMAVTCDKADT